MKNGKWNKEKLSLPFVILTAGVKIVRDHFMAISLDDIWYMFIMGRYEYSKDVDTFINSLSHKDL